MSEPASIEPARSEHTPSILSLLLAAFESPAERDLVADLLADPPDPTISLVAVRSGDVVGHALFTPVRVLGVAREWTAMGFAPLAVHPDAQRAGIGSRLARAGIDATESAGIPTTFVLGDPAYYPRFGFVPACPLGYRCKWIEPDSEHAAAFMVRGHDASRSPGLVRYHRAFDRF